MRWAIDLGIAPRFARLHAPVVAPTTCYPNAEYQTWMDRFATDESLALRTRITGLLCGTLGRPVTVIAVLKRSDVDDSGEHMTLRMGSSPVCLREPLPALIRRQLSAPRRWDTSSDWLFPAKLRAGSHADFSSFTRDFRSLGCSVVALRGAALLALASIMPLGPLRDLTGVSLNAASRWQLVAAAAYSEYPALRFSDGFSLPPPRTGPPLEVRRAAGMGTGGP